MACLPCGRVGGEKKGLAQLLGTTYPRGRPTIISYYDTPPPSHPSGVLVAPSMHEIDCAPATATP